MRRFLYDRKTPSPIIGMSVLSSNRRNHWNSRLEEAVRQLVVRHDSLRLRFGIRNGEWKAFYKEDAHRGVLPTGLSPPCPRSEQLSAVERGLYRGFRQASTWSWAPSFGRLLRSGARPRASSLRLRSPLAGGRHLARHSDRGSRFDLPVRSAVVFAEQKQSKSELRQWASDWIAIHNPSNCNKSCPSGKGFHGRRAQSCRGIRPRRREQHQ